MPWQRAPPDTKAPPQGIYESITVIAPLSPPDILEKLHLVFSLRHALPELLDLSWISRLVRGSVPFASVVLRHFVPRSHSLRPLAIAIRSEVYEEGARSGGSNTFAVALIGRVAV